MPLSRHEVRFLIKHEWQCGSSAVETCDRINRSWGAGTVERATCYRWFAKFKKGESDLNDLPHTGKPRKADYGDITRRIEVDPTLSKEVLQAEFGLTRNHINRILRGEGFIFKPPTGWIKQKKSLKKKGTPKEKGLESIGNTSTANQIINDTQLSAIQTLVDSELASQSQTTLEDKEDDFVVVWNSQEPSSSTSQNQNSTLQNLEDQYRSSTTTVQVNDNIMACINAVINQGSESNLMRFDSNGYGNRIEAIVSDNEAVVSGNMATVVDNGVVVNGNGGTVHDNGAIISHAQGFVSSYEKVVPH